MYGAKVVLNDVGDMYIKARLQQNALEASTWTKEASAPYPPAMRLSHAAMFALGEWTGIGFYGLTLVVAAIFVALSAWYFLQTRWYMFPLLYLNFAYFADRFVYVQDGSYVVMLAFVTVALVLTRRGRGATAPLLMAVATAMKLLPLYYARYVLRMSRRMAWCFAALLVVGLVLPAFVWDGYLDIYRFANERKGNDWLDVAGALLLVVPFTVTLWYVEERLAFAAEDRIGWSLVPFAMFTSLLTNSGRHLLIALIVPDRRAARNIAAAVGLTLHSLLPGLVRLGSVTYVTSAALIIALVLCLRQVGWDLVRDDLRHPLRTLRMLLSARAPAAVHRPAVL